MSEQQPIPPPGPERDIALAPLMGWTMTMAAVSVGGHEYWRPTGKFDYRPSPPPWSTDDAAVIDVLRAMAAKRYGWQMERDNEDGLVTVRLWREFALRGSANATSLADAITAAAIGAIEADESQKEERNEQ
ncbi:MAG: hypothetical protein WC718_14905 [Phycisphaerales bacterium]|jgi:hypothetical protein